MTKQCKVVFSGGLGNQLHQLCFLWHLQRLGVKARPDFGEFAYYAFHQGLELNKVLRTEYAAEVDRVERSRRRWYRLFNEKLGFWLRYHVRQLYNRYARTYIIENPSRVYGLADIPSTARLTLKGHWQQLAYVESVRERLLQSVSYDRLDTPRDRAIVAQIEACTSVSVHVRRGDYLKESQYQVTGGFAYYEKAMALVKRSHPDAHFFVFSDDIAWVKGQTSETSVTFVDWNSGADSFKDILLMSLCKHNIIANSTFSWWGAYLNANPGKMVVCPDEWLVGVPAKGRVPADWVELKA